MFYFILADFMSAESEECFSDVDFMKNLPIYHFWLIVKGMFWWVLAPVCWVITFLGLREQEA
jgi:hypothetical protein